MDTSALNDMLAAHTANLGPEQQALLKQMAGGSVDPQMLTSLGRQNPSAAALMQMMLSRRAAPSPARDCVVIDGTAQPVCVELVEELAARLDASNSATSRLEGELEELSSELRVLRERSDMLADALGACPLCWGWDGQCRACHGHGSPGRSIPDRTLFEEYVLPAVRMLRAGWQRARAPQAESSAGLRAHSVDTAAVHPTSL